MGKIIAFSNQKGGIGKTTSAVNVAAGVAKLGKKVLLIDLDPQGNATSGVGVAKKAGRKTSYDLLVGDIDPKEAVMETPFDNLWVVPTNIGLAGAEYELVNVDKRESVLRERLEELKKEFDYIMIDCPPSLGVLTVCALTASDGAVIPMVCEYYALEGLGQLINTINLVKKHLNKSIEIEGALLTMFDIRTNLSNQVVNEVNKYFENKVYKTVIPRNVKLSEAPSYGVPITIYDPRSKGAKCYDKLGRELIKNNEEQKAKHMK